jgi:predicted Zn finger-like uncharacterized protein
VLFVRREKMTEITQCPECGTRFKVTGAQLDAHDGLVRCGHCQDVFNAREHLHDDEPSPQLSLPIDIETPPTTKSDLVPDVQQLEEEPTTLAQQVQFIEELTDEVLEMPPRKTSWTGIFLALVLMLALLAQAAYYFRVELAARLPGIKPLLVQYCELLACTVPLPQKADLMAIESSDLQSGPGQSSIVILNALVHNRAPYAQAYPSLELTLTDMQDQALARRVFRPADYLKAGTDEKQGVPANRDLDIKLRLDTTDLKPSGYRLFLFYPQ